MSALNATARLSDDEMEQVAEIVLSSVDGVDTSLSEDAVRIELRDMESSDVAGVGSIEAYIEVVD